MNNIAVPGPNAAAAACCCLYVRVQDVSERYAISHMPAFKLIKGGAVIGEFEGTNVATLADLVVANKA